MWNWTPLEYKTVFTDLYNQFCDDPDTQATIASRFDRLLEIGNLARDPISKHLDDGIFELRAKDARFLFYFGDNRTIVFVHAIIKKRNDVPPGDIELAKKRRKEIRDNKNNKGASNGLTFIN